MATLIYLVFDPSTRRLRFANAGHPPVLVIGKGSTRYLADGLAPPIGATADDHFPEEAEELEIGSTLLLYTDGLVERRGESIQTGLERLSLAAAADGVEDIEALCDRLVSSLVDHSRVADDVALLAMRPAALTGAPLHISLPAEPRMLVQVRQGLGRWLDGHGITARDQNAIVLACGEACANVVQHAYESGSGVMVVDARLVGACVEIEVRDQGGWRAPADRGGGWGLHLMEAMMESVETDRRPDGTVVRMRLQVQVGGLG